MGRHERDHHDEKLPFACTHCQFRGLTQYTIDVHVGRYHSKKERIPCQQNCGQSFSQACSMYEHVRSACPKTVDKTIMPASRKLAIKKRSRKLIAKRMSLRAKHGVTHSASRILREKL